MARVRAAREAQGGGFGGGQGGLPGSPARPPRSPAAARRRPPATRPAPPAATTAKRSWRRSRSSARGQPLTAGRAGAPDAGCASGSPRWAAGAAAARTAASGAGSSAPNSNFQYGGSYIVFVLRNGQPTPVRVRTGFTDMDYSEVISGLTEKDTVLLLPSASLVGAAGRDEEPDGADGRRRARACPRSPQAARGAPAAGGPGHGPGGPR